MADDDDVEDDGTFFTDEDPHPSEKVCLIQRNRDVAQACPIHA